MLRRNRPSGPRLAPVLIAALALASAVASGAVPAPASSPRVRLGQEAPDFALKSPEGSVHRLSDLRGKKGLVLIFFRGTW
jgi:hypothetical protein